MTRAGRGGPGHLVVDQNDRVDRNDTRRRECSTRENINNIVACTDRRDNRRTDPQRVTCSRVAGTRAPNGSPATCYAILLPPVIASAARQISIDSIVAKHVSDVIIINDVLIRCNDIIILLCVKCNLFSYRFFVG